MHGWAAKSRPFIRRVSLRAWNHELEAHTHTITDITALILLTKLFNCLAFTSNKAPRTFTGIQAITRKTYTTLQATLFSLLPFILKSLRPPSLPWHDHVVEKEKAVVAVPRGAQAQLEGLPQGANIPKCLRDPKFLGCLHHHNAKCVHNLEDFRSALRHNTHFCIHIK